MHQFKAPIAGNSKAIAKIGNAELAHFNKQMLIHELIRGSLVITEFYQVIGNPRHLNVRSLNRGSLVRSFQRQLWRK